MESSRIFVRGLPPSFSSEDFKAHFSKQANVTDVKFIPHRRIGYVGYKTAEEAARAVKYHNNTFIRMSRIGVELARTVQEQQALTPAMNATNGVKRRYGLGGATREKHSENTLETSTPKSGGGKSCAEEAKLKEYLDVMQPPSKSKIWENQIVLIPEDSPATVSGSEMQQVIGAENDGDHEPVPKKQRMSSIVPNDMPLPKDRNLRNTEAAELAHMDSETPPITEQKTEDAANETVHIAQVASDADWLRSRTSRLLGLLDDDAPPESTVLSAGSEGQHVACESQTRNLTNGEMPDADAHPEYDYDHERPSTSVVTQLGMADTGKDNGRLFVRNLTYTTTEDDLRQHFEKGAYGTINELHLPIDSRTGSNKGFAHVQYTEPDAAAGALHALDRTPFQGRLLHIMPADAKKESGLDDFAISKLPLKKQQQIKRKAEAASSVFNWNSLYMNSDAIISSISDRLGVSKSVLLDPTSSDAAVKQAHAETHVIQETKSYFTTNGVDLDAFKRRERGDTAILVKNFSYSTKLEELRELFQEYGILTRLLMPPSGTIAIVEFDHPDHARTAFSNLAYRKLKDSILFLEKAPKGLFDGKASNGDVSTRDAQISKPLAKDLLERGRLQEPVNTSTLFVRNLNFSTTTKGLHDIFQPLGGLLSARVKTKPDPKKPGQLLSMGFGFLEFRTKEDAQAALSAMDGYKLDGHELLIRASHRAVDATDERRKEDQARTASGRKTKIIIKNLPFEASRKDVRSLFGAYGQLRSVRVPKKFDSSTRGFAFAEFVTARESENAMASLGDTHLLGRRLVLEFAAEDAVNPEQEIEKMQQKVGRQTDKVALQNLTGTGRKKFNVEGADEMDQG